MQEKNDAVRISRRGGGFFRRRRLLFFAFAFAFFVFEAAGVEHAERPRAAVRLDVHAALASPRGGADGLADDAGGSGVVTSESLRAGPRRRA